MKVTENSTYRLMKTNLNKITNDLFSLRSQGTSGLRVTNPSDDTGAIQPILTTRSQLKETDRYLETMGQTSDKMAATDGYIDQVENILQRAKEISINAVNGSLSQNDLNTLADEVGELRKNLLDTANAVVDGKYIFSGYEEDTKPFIENPSYDPNLYDVSDVTTWPYLYQGDSNTFRLEITPGEYVEANTTGNELFMGITNTIAATGYANPYQGESMTSTGLAVGTPGNDITIQAGSGAPITLSGATDLTDPVGENNYAAKLAGLFSQAGTGLVATAGPATANLGSLGLTNFVDGEDSYALNIASGGTTVSATLDGPSGTYDFTLDGLAAALGASGGATNVTATGGTLANGVSYDISSGSLILTGPADGSEIDLTETVNDGNPVAPFPSGGIGGGNQTAYGQLTIATNTTDDVTLSGAGLPDIGLNADTLDGSSGRVDIFTVLTRLEESLRAGNIDNASGASGSVQTQMDNLEVAADQERSLRASLGSRAQRVDTAITHQEDAQVDLKAILSRYQDADMVEVYNDIVQKETAFQAALNVTSRISQISILDYF